MKVTRVCCQGCGADLEIDDSIRYVTCNYCNTRLEVVHDETVTHTRLLDKIERTTERMANNLKVIELQNDLERLDREWESRRQSLLVRNKQGHVSEPSSVGSVAGGFVAIAVGVVWIIATSSMHAPLFPIFGLLIIGVAIYGMVSGTNKATAFKSGRENYESEREDLIARLEEERRR
ncbi:MAG: hypothetical protein EOP85_05690 [Verrucomicrobiaceae bacterium]|nr:MAG: hypothetical protein EOP85_05690 [Verrucomicrobiaceae bacterium]